MYTLLRNLRVINARQLVGRQAILKSPPFFSVILADNFKRVSFYKLLVRVPIHLSCCKCLSFEHCLNGSNNLGLLETLSQPSRYPDFYAYSVSLRHVVGRHIHEYRRRLGKGKKTKQNK